MKSALLLFAFLIVVIPSLAQTNLPAAQSEAARSTENPSPVAKTVGSNAAPAKVEGPIIFEKLLSTNNSVLMTNAEFKKPFGHKLIFTCTNNFHSDLFDIDILHPSVLERLKIDSDKAKEDQAKLDEAKQQLVAGYNKQRQDLLQQQAAAAEKAKADAAAALQAQKDKAASGGNTNSARAGRHRPK